jgi:hypothetical protein
MARIGDAPMPLRPVARELNRDLVARLPKWELVAILAQIQALRDRADYEPPEAAAACHRMAGQILNDGRLFPPMSAPVAPSRVSRKRWTFLRGGRLWLPILRTSRQARCRTSPGGFRLTAGP